MKIKDEELDKRKMLTSYEFPSMDQILAYFEKECEIYDIFHNKVTYSCEEHDEKDIDYLLEFLK